MYLMALIITHATGDCINLMFGGISGKPWALTAKGAKNAKDSNKNSLRTLRSLQ
jgi:hypothetical protein